jgi:phospholipase B1
VLGNEICPKGQYRDDIDVLNAAQSGARSLNLDHQTSYLFDRLDEEYKIGRVKPTDWKLITVFIGSNDICHSCTEPTSLPLPFGANVWSTVETLRKSMTNTLVQISKFKKNTYEFCVLHFNYKVGLMRVQDIVISTSNYTNYCQPIKGSSFIGHDHECECSHSIANLTIMNQNFPAYNQALQQVVAHYKEPNDTFAVIYQPLLVDIMSFPIQAIRYKE